MEHILNEIIHILRDISRGGNLLIITHIYIPLSNVITLTILNVRGK